MKNVISCPSCQTEINIEDVLAKRIETEYKIEFQKKLDALNDKEANLEKARKSIDEVVKQKLNTERNTLVLQLETKLKVEKENEFKQMQEELDSKSKTVSELRLKEGELLKEKREIAEIKAGMQSELETKLAEEAKKLEAKLKVKVQNDADLKLKEKEILIQQLNERVQDMQKKMEQGSTQVQGEAQELLIEETLASIHPFDTIREIKKGQNGADVLQVVRNTIGAECGKVLYESKNTKNFNNEWVTKLREDMQLEGAEIGVIITQAMPKGVSDFVLFDENIWICSYDSFKAFTFTIRQAILKINEVKLVQHNQGEKTTILYNYLMGTEFKAQFKIVHDTFADMHNALIKEKKAALARFSKREKHIGKIMINLASIAGSLNGISGKEVVEWAEFDEVEEVMAISR